VWLNLKAGVTKSSLKYFQTKMTKPPKRLQKHRKIAIYEKVAKEIWVTKILETALLTLELLGIYYFKASSRGVKTTQIHKRICY
jgi:hypothetical protein